LKTKHNKSLTKSKLINKRSIVSLSVTSAHAKPANQGKFSLDEIIISKDFSHAAIQA